MFRHRPMLGFFIALPLIYGLLIAPWPFISRAYTGCFRAAGNLLFSSIGPAGSVRFENQSVPDDEWATRLSFKNRRTGAEGSLERVSARPGYLMAAMITALILATPIPWSRKWKSLLLGLLLANLVFALGLWLSLLDVFSSGGPLAQFTPSPFWANALKLAVKILALSPEVPFALPVFIWLLVTIRLGDVRRWLDASRPHKPAGERRPVA